MINRVVLVGRMTKNPELRRTPSGAAVTNFTLAINRNFSNTNGERQTDFINCVVWNKAAENVDRYCSKGALVGIEGRIQSRQYATQDGTKRIIVEVICDTVQFIETKHKEYADPFKDPSLQNIDINVRNYEILDDPDMQF